MEFGAQYLGFYRGWIRVLGFQASRTVSFGVAGTPGSRLRSLL